MRSELLKLAAKIRNRLVLPKTLLQELQKLSGKTEHALLSIEELIEDVEEVQRRYEEKKGGKNDET